MREIPIWRGNKIIGSITSGAYGHRIGASLGMGYIENDGGVDDAYLSALPLEIEIAWKRYPVRAQLIPWYDARAERVKS